MKQQVPTWVAIVIIVAVLVIAGMIVWRKAGEKPIVGFPETGVSQQRPKPGGPTGGAPTPSPAPSQPEQR